MNKKPILIAGVCIAVLALAGFFGVLPHMEKRFEEDVAAFLQRFSGTARSVKVDLLGGELTLTDVRLSYEHFYGDLVKGTFAADEIIVRGFNRKALTQEGAARKIADSVEMTGVDIRTVSSLLADEGRKRLKTLTEHDVSGDLARLVAPARREPGIKGAAEALDVLRTFHFGAVSGTGYEAEMEMPGGGGNIQVTADGFRLKDASLLEGSDFVCDNLKMGYMGMDMLSMDSMSFASTSTPDYYMPLMEDEAARLEGVEPTVRAARLMRGFARALEEQSPLTVKGLKIVNLTCPFIRSGIKEILADVQLAARDVSLRVNFAGVSLPASVYTTLGGFMAGFARAHNNSPLNLDAGLDLEAFWKGRDGEIRLKKFFLEDKNLASVEVSGNLGMNGNESWLESIAGETGTDALLKDMRATLTDSKLLDTVCMGLAMGAPDKAAAIRAQFASEMADKAGQEKDPDFRRILEGAAEFARAPGSLTVSVRLDKPVPLEKLNYTPSDTVLGLNATVEYSPAGNGGGASNLP